MDSTTSQPSGTPKPNLLPGIAWLAMLLASPLPEAISFQLAGAAPQSLFWVKAGLLAVLIVLTWPWGTIHSLRPYLALLTINTMAWRLFPLIRATPTWSRWEHQVPWLTGMLSIQLLKFGIALLTITALFVLMRRRRSFFLVRGNLDALGDPVPWLGLRHPVSWNILGPVVAVVAAGSMIVVLGLTNHYRVATVLAAAPLLPAAVLLSLTNAFNEEVSYRCSLLAPLYEVVGKTHAMVLTAVFFGLAHYSGGVPLAVIPSVLMTGFLGWFMGKSMLETKGFFWAWFIHSVNDIPVFATLAMVAVMAARQAG